MRYRTEDPTLQQEQQPTGGVVPLESLDLKDVLSRLPTPEARATQDPELVAKQADAALAAEAAKKTFDVDGFLKGELGMELVGKGDKPGTIKVKTRLTPELNSKIVAGQGFSDGSYYYSDFDLNGFMKDEAGVDLTTQAKVQFNTPETAIKDAPMNFMDRMLFDVARSPKDKVSFLIKRFGRENIAMNPETGDLFVKKDDMWFDPSKTGLAGAIGSDGDVTLGAIGGAALGGAAAGSVVGPGGTALGALAVATSAALGAGVGAIVARLGTWQGAYQAGIRTEEDISQINDELAREFIFAAAGEGAGAALVKGGRAALRGTANATAKLSEKLGGPEAIENFSRLLNQWNGLDPQINKRILENPHGVSKHQIRQIEWNNLPTTKQANVANPLVEEQIELLTSTAERMKQQHFKRFGDGMKELRPVLERTKIDVDPYFKQVESQLQELGLLDANGKWVDKVARDMSEGQQKIIDPAGINRLRNMHTQMQKLKRRAARETGDQLTEQQPTLIAEGMGGKAVNALTEQAALPGMSKKPGLYVSFDEANNLRHNIYDLLEISGGFKGASAEVSSTAVANMERAAGSINEAIERGLGEQSDVALMQWKRLNTAYSGESDFLKSIASATRENRVKATVAQLLDPKTGHAYQKHLSGLMENSGESFEKLYGELIDREAAIQSAPRFREGAGGFWSGPADLVARGPRRAVDLSRAWNGVKRKADAVNYLMSLDKKQLAIMHKNPVLFNAINQAVAQSEKAEEETERQLLGGGGAGGQQ
jgi:hypothetical protein